VNLPNLQACVYTKIQQQKSLAGLVVFRMLFGLLAFYACIWSWLKADLTQRFTEPTFMFKYWGFEWVQVMAPPYLKALYIIWGIAALGMLTGTLYRLSVASFFLLFTYFQLLDATNYINHYYAISLFAFLMCFLPANAAYSGDVYFGFAKRKTQIPAWIYTGLQMQVALIYFGASWAKCNPDWLFRAMPMKIWLLQSTDFPIIGELFNYHFIHLSSSWFAFLYDASIPFLLWFSYTRKWGYALLAIFHILTAILFNIGLFPHLMLVLGALFFEDFWATKFTLKVSVNKTGSSWLKYFFIGHLAIQVLLPLRYLSYNRNPLWTEEGYRFSWWVMLVEKEGAATFYVEDIANKRTFEIENSDYLTGFQIKRMAVRPDHIAQFARFLKETYQEELGLAEVRVRADVFVALNGRVSQRLIDPAIDLSRVSRGFGYKDWILPFKGN
jgi:hypothetical protein